MNDFPDYFKLSPAGAAWSSAPPWLVLHRYYLWTMAYLMILNPIRPYMAKSYEMSSPKIELDIHAAGLLYARKLTMALDGWVGYTTHRDGWFHFQIFSIFDVASMLCSAIKHDEHDVIPERLFVFDAIDSCVSMLQRLNQISDTVDVWHNLLLRQAKQLPRPVELFEEAQRKKSKRAESSENHSDPDASPRRIKSEPSEGTGVEGTQLPAEHDPPGLDVHSSSISPSSENTLDMRSQSNLVLAEDLQPQLDTFSQALDLSFFQELTDGNGEDWLNWPNFDMEDYFAPGGYGS